MILKGGQNIDWKLISLENEIAKLQNIKNKNIVEIPCKSIEELRARFKLSSARHELIGKDVSFGDVYDSVD